jgi:hypothetical protein
MPEFALTQWLDPVFDYFARESGIPVGDYTAVAGGEGIGATEELILDTFCTGLLGKIIQLGTGLGCTLGAIFSKGLSPRLKRELITWGQHSLTRVIDPKPSDIIELFGDIDKFVAGLKLGHAGTIYDALLRNPEELKAMLAVLQGQRVLSALPTTTPTPPSTLITVPTAIAPIRTIYA